MLSGTRYMSKYGARRSEHYSSLQSEAASLMAAIDRFSHTFLYNIQNVQFYFIYKIGGINTNYHKSYSKSYNQSLNALITYNQYKNAHPSHNNYGRFPQQTRIHNQNIPILFQLLMQIASKAMRSILSKMTIREGRGLLFGGFRVGSLFCNYTQPYGKNNRLNNNKLKEQIESNLKFGNQSEDDDFISNDNNRDSLENNISNPKTIQILKKKGISNLFPIQMECFQAIEEGMDVLASDRTGSGKTIAYSLPIIEKYRREGIFNCGRSKFQKNVKFLIMCPTRELTLQVSKEISSLKHNENDFHVVSVYGGSPINNQIVTLRRGVDIVVATPGRLIDLIKRGQMVFDSLRATCIDEADHMLEKGFQNDIEEIYEFIREHNQEPTQNLMFSATIPSWVHKIAKNYLSNNVRKISLISNSQELTSKTVAHLALKAQNSMAWPLTKQVIEKYNPTQRTIIFVQRKKDADECRHYYRNEDVAILHGDISQSEREKNLSMFRQKKRKILVATDVAARGLDIPDVELVVQMSPPEGTEPYIHRSGRTGRAGKQGTCVTLFNSRNIDLMVSIQDQVHIKFHQIQLNSENSHEQFMEYCQNTIRQIRSPNLKKNLYKYKQVASQLLQQYSAEQAIQRILLLNGPMIKPQLSLINKKKGRVTYELFMKNEDNSISLSIDGEEIMREHFEDIMAVQYCYIANRFFFDVQEHTHQAILGMNDLNDNEYFGISIARNYPLPSIKQQAGSFRNRSINVSYRRNNKQVKHRGRDQRGMFQRKQRLRYDPKYNQSASPRYNESSKSRNDQRSSLDEPWKQNSNKIFISAISNMVNESEVVQIMESNGIKVTKCFLKKGGRSDDDFGQYAFVDVADTKSYQNALNSSLVIDGRTIKIRPKN